MVTSILKSRQLKFQGHFAGGLVDTAQATIGFTGYHLLTGRHFEQTADKLHMLTTVARIGTTTRGHQLVVGKLDPDRIIPEVSIHLTRK
jgi:hypothetical protein